MHLAFVMAAASACNLSVANQTCTGPQNLSTQCASDFDGPNHPCLSVSQPVCVGFVNGKAWGHCCNGSWSPPPPPTPMPWPGTYNLSRSTLVFPDGNHTGLDNARRAAVMAHYGLVTFGWETDVCNTARPSTSKSKCMYSGTEAALDAAAAQLKSINPDVKVVHYRNTKLGLSIYKDQCEKMYDPAFSGFYLKNKSNNGATINDPVAFPGDGVADCPGAGKQAMDQYLTDFRNASAAAWFVDTVVGRVARSPHADGVWFDDPSGIGAENPGETQAFTPAQIKEIRAATTATLLQAAESLIAVGKPLIFNVPVGLRTFQPAIDENKGRDKGVCMSALRAGSAIGATNFPSIYYIPYFAPPATGPTVAKDFRQHLAAFLLMRGQYSWFGHNWINFQPPVWYPEWDWDVGEPTGPMVEHTGGMFSRVWTKGTVTLNCSSWEVELPFSQ